MTKSNLLLAEPRGDDFDALLRFAETSGSFASVALQTNAMASSTALAFISSIEIAGADSSRVTSWPGTELVFGADATLWTFCCTADVCDLIREHSNGLFDWQAPDLPDDLCFYRPDGEVWLETTAHERSIRIFLDPKELRLSGLGSFVGGVDESA